MQFWRVLGASALALVSCRHGDGNARPTEAVHKASPEPPLLDLSPGPLSGKNRFSEDPLWKRAAGGQELDLFRLAQKEGAYGLLEGVDAGRDVALTALAALPHAPDAELALGRLCDLLKQLPSPPNHALLESIRDVAARPPTQREVVDSTGYARCLVVTRALDERTDLDPAQHDLVSSAVQLLVEHRDAARH